MLSYTGCRRKTESFEEVTARGTVVLSRIQDQLLLVPVDILVITHPFIEEVLILRYIKRVVFSRLNGPFPLPATRLTKALPQRPVICDGTPSLAYECTF
jgi:hypothetical protein